MDDKNQKAQTDDSQQVSSGTPGVSKEQEPGVALEVESNIEIEEAPGEHKEVEPSKEVGEFVKPTAVKPKIPADVKKAGVKHTGPTTPVQKKPSKTITLPLTDDEIVQGLHAHIWQALHWLAAWCIKKLKKAHIVVKEVHGKLVKS